ncbi:hypothetical protein LINPERHAP1_LOCUS9060, partial [Linum perenne]
DFRRKCLCKHRPACHFFTDFWQKHWEVFAENDFNDQMSADCLEFSVREL